MTLRFGRTSNFKSLYRILYVVFIIHVYNIFLFSQSIKGNEPVFNNNSAITPYDKVLLIGISKYDKYRPELKYADEDAKAFFSYLTEFGVNKSNKDNIRILLNDSATTGNIESGMRWLMDIKPNEKVLFYFSGHGATESELQPEGFLVCFNTPDGTATTMSMNMRYLTNMVKTIVKKLGSIHLIIDACNSGTISFKEYFSESPEEQSKENEKVIKLFSCGANESSFEDKIWAHQIVNNSIGGGAFTYNLLLGLIGFADIDNSGDVNLFELRTYLMNNVRKQTENKNKSISQNPLGYGNLNSILSTVDPSTMTDIKAKSDIENIKFNKSSISKGSSQGIAINDSLIIKKYADFRKYLELDKLIQPLNDNAYQLYSDLSIYNDSNEIVTKMKNELIIALRDKSIFALDMYLRGRDIPEFVSIEDANNNLETTLNLIDESDLFYNDIKAQHLFFEGAINIKFGNFQAALINLDEALKYIDYAGYIYNEKANIYVSIGDTNNAELNYENAIKYSNKWVIPLYNLGILNYDTKKNYRQALNYFNKAINLNTGHLSSYLKRGNTYFMLKKYKLAAKDWEMVIKLDPSFENQLRPNINEAIRLSKNKR